MKKLFLFLLVGFFTLQAFAQMGPLPTDPKTLKGKLPNGLTYYIRANAEPKGQAEFFIAQKVGSMQELDNQRGLAHFLEHMAFNGTKNFPDDLLFHFCESIGVKFGVNLNAYTSWEETVYNLSAAPTTRPGIIDSCLLVLHDWSSSISLMEDDINSERGVIREEIRTRNTADFRFLQKLLPLIYPDNLYGDRWVSGTLEVIENFTPEELRAYYQKWYRPDHQAIIIVGDINPAEIEAKIKTMFADIPAPVAPSELKVVALEENKKPIIAFITDPEATGTSISINYKQDILPAEVKLSAQGLIMQYVTAMIGSMFDERFREIIEKSNAPFIEADATYGPFFVAKTADALTFNAASKEGGLVPAYKALINEISRVKQHGFTQGEYDRARAQYLSYYEQQYNERDKRGSASYARECSRNFIDNECMAGIELEYSIISQIAPEVNLAMINQSIQGLIGDSNIVIYGNGPEKAGVTYPSIEELLAIYEHEIALPQQALEDQSSNEPLMTKLPKPGKITKTETDALFGTTIYTLSNGIRVIVKPTDFKADEIVCNARSLGGSSLFEDKDIVNAKLMDEIINVGGLGNFSATALTKALAGKRVSVNFGVGNYTEDISASCAPKDLETMMQLIYLSATNPRMDSDAFSAFLERQKAQLESYALNPMVSFSDTLTAKLYGKHPRAARIHTEELTLINYTRVMELYKQRFANMGDFVFTLVGNIDEATLKPLLCRYIATLPAKKGVIESYKDVQLYPLMGERKSHFDKEMQTLKATVCAVYTGKMDYTKENILKLDIFSQVMDIVYTKEIREKEGGTYGVAVQTTPQFFPVGTYTFLIFFDTDGKLAEKLVGIVYRELEKISKEGPDAETMTKIKAYLLKDFEEKSRNNNAWLKGISNTHFLGVNTFSGMDKVINSITADDIKAIAKKILSDNNKAEIIMTGVEMAK